MNIEIIKNNVEKLLELKDQIDSRVKYLNKIKKETKKVNEKNFLCDLEKDDKIFCIHFIDLKIYDMDYVKINFYKKEDENYSGYTNFSTESDTKPIGCSSALKDECMNNHYFLSEFGTQHFYFFTLKPQNWKNDLNCELNRLVKSKKNRFNEEIEKFKNSIHSIILNDEVNDLISDFCY